MRILAVDDNAAYRGILDNQLSKLGVRCRHRPPCRAGDGRTSPGSKGGQAFSRGHRRHVLAGHQRNGTGRGSSRPTQTCGRRTADVDGHEEHTIDPAELKRIGFSHCLTKPMRQSQMFDAIMEAVLLPTLSRRGRARSPPPQDPSSPRARQAHILLAEDNPVNQTVAIRTAAGCRVHLRYGGDGNAASPGGPAQTLRLDPHGLSDARA